MVLTYIFATFNNDCCISWLHSAPLGLRYTLLDNPVIVLKLVFRNTFQYSSNMFSFSWKAKSHKVPNLANQTDDLISNKRANVSASCVEASSIVLPTCQLSWHSLFFGLIEPFIFHYTLIFCFCDIPEAPSFVHSNHCQKYPNGMKNQMNDKGSLLLLIINIQFFLFNVCLPKFSRPSTITHIFSRLLHLNNLSYLFDVFRPSFNSLCHLDTADFFIAVLSFHLNFCLDINTLSEHFWGQQKKWASAIDAIAWQISYFHSLACQNLTIHYEI